MQIAIVGLDLAKSVFQVHGVDARGKAVLAKRLRRSSVLSFFASMPPCTVGMEACASAHYWAREIGRFGHTMRLLPPQYVRPYVKRHKNDTADAEAICEAVQRPTMRFVPVKTEEQQGMLVIHRVREMLMRQRGQLIKALRGHLAEFGVVAPQGAGRISDLTARLADPGDDMIPAMARAVLQVLVEQLRATERRTDELDQRLHEEAARNEACRRLSTIPGIGPITATALAATITDAKAFASGRHLAAWLGLVPRQYSSGGRERLGGISKAGDGYLRRLLVQGAQALLRWRSRATPWIKSLLRRRPVNVVAVAIANKTARIVWAVMVKGETYRRPEPAAVAG
jgi:transposase